MLLSHQWSEVCRQKTIGYLVRETVYCVHIALALYVCLGLL